MQVSYNSMLGTKMIVPKRDINVVQNLLLKAGFGYELALDKSFIGQKFYKEDKYVAFFIDNCGVIEIMRTSDLDDPDFVREYRMAIEQEIAYEVVF